MHTGHKERDNLAMCIDLNIDTSNLETQIFIKLEVDLAEQLLQRAISCAVVYMSVDYKTHTCVC